MACPGHRTGCWALQALFSPGAALGLAELAQEEALTIAREMESQKYAADALTHLGGVTLHRGEYHESFAFCQQNFELKLKYGSTYGMIENLAGVAEVASLLRQSEQAARPFGAVEALGEVRGIQVSPDVEVKRRKRW